MCSPPNAKRPLPACSKYVMSRRDQIKKSTSSLALTFKGKEGVLVSRNFQNSACRRPTICPCFIGTHNICYMGEPPPRRRYRSIRGAFCHTAVPTYLLPRLTRVLTRTPSPSILTALFNPLINRSDLCLLCLASSASTNASASFCWLDVPPLSIAAAKINVSVAFNTTKFNTTEYMKEARQVCLIDTARAVSSRIQFFNLIETVKLPNFVCVYLHSGRQRRSRLKL